MSKQTVFVTLCVCATAIVITAITAVAGPLTPPVGPVASTPGPEPRIPVGPDTTPGDASARFIISQPGSYYLEGNIVGAGPSQRGIMILASNVTLDLNGFSVVGPGKASDSGQGIFAFGTRDNVVVKNGIVSDWRFSGVDALVSRSVRVENVQSFRNGFAGIRAGENSVVVNCVARENSAEGIIVEAGSAVIGCASRMNGEGFQLADACSLVSSVATGNFTGVFAGKSSVISACNSSNNTTAGYRIGAGSTVTDSTAQLNGGAGFDLTNPFTTGGQTTVRGCAATENGGDGFSAAESSVSFESCVATLNGGDGFDLGDNMTVIGCTANENSGDGIRVAQGGTVRSCATRRNDGDGIEVSAFCAVVGNQSSLNGVVDPAGAGVLVTGSDNRIEGNTCGGNVNGVRLTAGFNIVVKNVLNFNTTAVEQGAFTSNLVGPISGDATTAGPWDNFNF